MAQAQERIQNDILPKSSTHDVCLHFNMEATPSLPFHSYLKQLPNINKCLKMLREKTASIQEKALKDVELRFLQASPNAPILDIYVNNKLVVTAFSYKQVSSYLTLPQGKCQIHICPAGNRKETVLCEEIYTESGNSYTIAVVGEYQELQLFSFINSPKVPPGEAKARFIHLALETSAVDLAVKDRDIVFAQVSFKQATEYLGLTPMTIDLELRTAGSHKVILPIPKLQFKANNVYSIAFVGFDKKHPSIDAILLKD